MSCTTTKTMQITITNRIRIIDVASILASGTAGQAPVPATHAGDFGDISVPSPHE